MTDEFLQKILEILTNIHRGLEPVPFWKDWDFWSFLALASTLFFLIKYTRATEKMAENQIMPAVDVNMCYNQGSKKTYFWFSNTSNLPGMVHLKHRKNDEVVKETHTPLRVPPNESMKTADSDFGFSPSEGDKITLYVVVTPAMDDSKAKVKFEKSYHFKDNQWHESTWNFPDRPYLF